MGSIWNLSQMKNSRKVRLLNRNNGLLLKSLDVSKYSMDICELGTIQKGIFNTANNCYGGEMVKIEKKKSVKKEEIKNDNTLQLSIDKAWK